jgi:type VI secretion system protein VasD
MMRLAAVLITAAMLGLLGGCAKPAIDLAVASQTNVNPDHTGRPSPVIVKVFEMRSDLAFNQADFRPLFESPVKVLGADLLAMDEMVLVPGEARRIEYAPVFGTMYLGVVAGFRQLDRAVWRVVEPIDFEDRNFIGVELRDASILLIPPDEAPDWDPLQAVRDFHDPVADDAAITDEPAQLPEEELPAESVRRPLSSPGLLASPNR